MSIKQPTILNNKPTVKIEGFNLLRGGSYHNKFIDFIFSLWNKKYNLHYIEEDKEKELYLTREMQTVVIISSTLEKIYINTDLFKVGDRITITADYNKDILVLIENGVILSSTSFILEKGSIRTIALYKKIGVKGDYIYIWLYESSSTIPVIS